MIFRFRLICLVSSVFYLTQCASCYYTPNAHNVPLFKEKNVAAVNGSYQIGEYSSGLNLQVAYACTDHIGVMVNYNYFGGSYTFRIDNAKTSSSFNGNLIEVGAGYFLPFKDKFVFETYGGIGWGGVKNSHFSTYFIDNSNNKVKYNRYFLQPAIGWQPIKILTLAFSSRFGLLDYRNINIQLGDLEEIRDEVQIDSNPSFLIEPAITLRIGGRVVSFQVQTVYSYNLTNPDAYYDPLGITFGLFFNIYGKNHNN